MSRTLSSTFLQAAYAQQTSEVFLVLLVINSDTPIYVVNNTENITSNGTEYIAFPFSLSLAGDMEDQLPAITVSISNVDRQIVAAVRELTAPITATVSVILADHPDTVEIGPIEFTLREVEYDASSVTGTLQPADLLEETFPCDSYTPANFPGLF